MHPLPWEKATSLWTVPWDPDILDLEPIYTFLQLGWWWWGYYPSFWRICSVSHLVFACRNSLSTSWKPPALVGEMRMPQGPLPGPWWQGRNNKRLLPRLGDLPTSVQLEEAAACIQKNISSQFWNVTQPWLFRLYIECSVGVELSNIPTP